MDIFETLSCAVRGWTPQVTSKQRLLNCGVRILEIASINCQFLKIWISEFFSLNMTFSYEVLKIIQNKNSEIHLSYFLVWLHKEIVIICIYIVYIYTYTYVCVYIYIYTYTFIVSLFKIVVIIFFCIVITLQGLLNAGLLVRHITCGWYGKNVLHSSTALLIASLNIWQEPRDWNRQMF